MMDRFILALVITALAGGLLVVGFMVDKQRDRLQEQIDCLQEQSDMLQDQIIEFQSDMLDVLRLSKDYVNKQGDFVKALKLLIDRQEKLNGISADLFEALGGGYPELLPMIIEYRQWVER